MVAAAPGKEDFEVKFDQFSIAPLNAPSSRGLRSRFLGF
jgi:hypothetical protein